MERADNRVWCEYAAQTVGFRPGDGDRRRRLIDETIKNKQNNFVTVSIFNEAGILVQSGQYKLNSMAVISVDIQKLITGRYFIKTITDNEEATVMFIKN